MRCLVDTNILLEILLDDEKKLVCESFIADYSGTLFVSDFSAHSIGVIGYRINRLDIFERFLEDILPNVSIARLQDFSYYDLLKDIKRYSLDFDDAYQLTIAREYSLDLATMDKNFKKVTSERSIIFL